MSRETAQAAVDALGLKVRAEFVPFSRSRNANAKDDRGNKRRSLNWRVTLVRVHGAGNEAGRDILTTDYSAGVAHCPSYKQGARWTLDYTALIDHEIETGRRAKLQTFGGVFSGPAILPDSLDVIASLVMDSSVLDESTFEDWADSLGYDVDSRKAESIYRACIEIALQLRNGIGESGLATLRDAFQDY